MVEEYSREHPAEETFQNVLLPALSLAKRRKDDERFTVEDEQELYQVTRELLDDLVLPDGPARAESPARVFGVPAGNEADEVALLMLARLMRPTGCEFEVLSAQALSGELVARIRDEDPQVICVAALAPQSVAHTRYLCKRLRAAFPEKKLVLGCWGYNDPDRARQRLASAVADHVGMTLEETRTQLTPLVQFLAHSDEPAAADGNGRQTAARTKVVKG